VKEEEGREELLAAANILCGLATTYLLVEHNSTLYCGTYDILISIVPIIFALPLVRRWPHPTTVVMLSTHHGWKR
jgi:hypothetical protein